MPRKKTKTEINVHLSPTNVAILDHVRARTHVSRSALIDEILGRILPRINVAACTTGMVVFTGPQLHLMSIGTEYRRPDTALDEKQD